MEKPNDFSLVMASDRKYIPYLTTAIASIRRYNNHVRIDIYTCADSESFSSLSNSSYTVVHQVDVPQELRDSLGEGSEKLEHTLTRIAKIASMRERRSNTMMFVDSDVLVLDDLKKITEELELKGSDKPIVYMLLRRPQLLSLNDIGWLYLRDAPGLSFQQMADLINETFSLDYSADQLQNVNCWNSGIVYGSPEGIKMLADQWSKYYTVMLTGKNKDSFIPNDQLCLWLAIDHLVDKVTVKELPLAWNFMPGHALEKIMSKATPSLDEIKASLRGVRILHFAQNKADSWVQRLIELAPFS